MPEPKPTQADLDFWEWQSDPFHDPGEYVEIHGEGWFHRDELVHVDHIPLDAKMAVTMRRVLAEQPLGISEPSKAGGSEFLSISQFAKRLGVDRKTVERQLTRMTEGIHFLRLGRRIVLKTEAATAFLAGQSSKPLKPDDLLAAFESKAKRR